MPAAVLNVLHPMIGPDLHDNLIPSPVGPVPTPPKLPHVAFMLLGGVTNFTSHFTSTTFVNFTQSRVVLQGSDIGPLIPHVPVPILPNILLVVIIPGSGSVSEFFAFSVKAKDGTDGQMKPVATAIAGFGGLNVNCGSPCAMPTGVVIAPSTVCTGFRLGDFFASLVGMAMDVGLSWGLSKLMGGLGRSFGGIAGRLAGRFGPGIVSGIVGQAPALARYLSPKVVENVIATVLGMVAVGSPTGYSSEDASVVGHYYGNAKSAATQGIADLFNPPPGGTM